jgi:hypothetical protein
MLLTPKLCTNVLFVKQFFTVFEVSFRIPNQIEDMLDAESSSCFFWIPAFAGIDMSLWLTRKHENISSLCKRGARGDFENRKFVHKISPPPLC